MSITINAAAALSLCSSCHGGGGGGELLLLMLTAETDIWGIEAMLRATMWDVNAATNPTFVPLFAVLVRKLLIDAIWLDEGVSAIMTRNSTWVLRRTSPDIMWTSLEAVANPCVSFIQILIVSLKEASTGGAEKKSGFIPVSVKVA